MNIWKKKRVPKIEKFVNYNLPLTVIKWGLVLVISAPSWVCTKATWAVICCEFELLGDDAPEFVGKMVDTVIGASSLGSVWSMGTTSMIETPSDVVPVWSMYFFYMCVNDSIC